MTRIALRVEECCADCRRPVKRCRGAACEKPNTYPGVLLRGEWRRVDQPQWDASAEQMRQAA